MSAREKIRAVSRAAAEASGQLNLMEQRGTVRRRALADLATKLESAAALLRTVSDPEAGEHNRAMQQYGEAAETR